MKNYKNEVKQLLSPYFKEATVNATIKKLEEMKFFEQSCSTKFHGNYRSGLIEHSIEVAKNLIVLTRMMGHKWQRPASPIIVGLFHDLCKFDAYITADGITFTWNVAQCGGGKHAIKSLALLKEYFSFLDVTMEEQVSILWHMGGFSKELKDKTFNFNADMKEYPFALQVQNADMISTYQGLIEVSEEVGKLFDKPTEEYPFSKKFLLG